MIKFLTVKVRLLGDSNLKEANLNHAHYYCLNP